MSRPPVIRFTLLGAFRIYVNGRQAVRPLTLRQQQVLACLLLDGGGQVPRLRIASRLWPESTDAQALTNLRREWHHLRDAWPELDARLDAGSRAFAWRGDAPENDVAAFERAARSGLEGDRTALSEAAGLYGGDLLPECHDDWIQPDRDRLRQQAVAVLSTLVGLLEQEGAPGDVIAHAQRLLQIDPLNEPAWCAMMRGHARRGERATALHLYQQCASLLERELGVAPSAATRATYREILDLDEDEESAAAAPVTQAASVFPLIGREVEWATLLASCQAASAGRPHLLLVRGEAGIGKSRLVEELVTWCRAHGLAASTTRCYAGDGRLAYAPISTWLRSAAVTAALTSLDGVWLTDVARLRPDLLTARPDVRAPEARLDPLQRTRFFDALTHAFHAAAPLILVLDDLQWADADTLDWLHYFLRTDRPARCLVVGTARAEEEQDNRPLVELLSELRRLDRLEVVELGPLDEIATARLAEEVTGQPLNSHARARMFRQTEGHPLFVVEQGRMERASQGGEEVSARVQAVVAARLAHLSNEAREVATVAAAVGRDFPFEILAEVSDLEEDAVVHALDELWRRHIVRVQAEGHWDFSHDRIREVAYAEIGPARRRLLHRRIARALERLFAADLDAVSAPIAIHLDRGGQPMRAIPFLERAADVAMRVSATEEAIRCLTHALALVARMPTGRDRDQRELDLRGAISPSLTSARGYGAIEVEQNLERIVGLSAALGGRDVPVRWLWALWAMHFVHGNMASARDAAERAMVASRGDPSCLCEAHHAMAGILISLGELEAARTHFEASLAAYDERWPQQSAFGSDLGVFSHAWYAHDLWLLGDPDAARAEAEEAIALSLRLDHAYSQVLALAYAGMTFQLRREAPRVLECAERVLALCERYGFGYYDDWARILLGWTRGQEGHPSAGVELIERGLARLDAQRALTRRPYYLSLLAETLVVAGDRERAALVIAQGADMARSGGDRWWLPELLRQQAMLAPASRRPPLVAEALAEARRTGSQALERRIAEAAEIAGTA